MLPLPAQTPAGRPFDLPEALARAIEAEWAAQDKKPNFATMPLTRIAFTAIDRIADLRDEVIHEMMEYANTDLMCYRAESGRLRERQDEVWGGVLSRMESDLGVRFVIASGIMPVPQPQATLDTLYNTVAHLDLFELAALAVLAQGLGSLVLALAYLRGHVELSRLTEISQMEERFQLEEWGEDDALRARLGRVEKEINDAARFYILAHS